MRLSLASEVVALNRMSTTELRVRYTVVFGEATAANNKAWLVRRIAWRLQANAEGDLSERARARAVELARDADLRVIPPKQQPEAEEPRVVSGAVAADRRLPPPGSILTRKYKGGVVEVKVLADGFEYAGEIYASLSAVAKAVTGSHCNGFLFFRLGQHGGTR